MNLAEEYRLSEYRDLGMLDGNDKVHIVRNGINGMICVRKVLAPELMDIYQFLRNHHTPYTPEIYECIQTQDHLIVIEEYFAGRNLEELVSERRFSETQAGEIIIELCKCLRMFHNAVPPIICRDLKAQNVIMTNDGKIKLIDFDIARVYQPGKGRDMMLMGTQGYAAPEQFGFGQTDARTDIYSLGVLLNYLLIQSFPVEKMISGRLEPIVRTCIQMRPEDRYQSVDALAEAIANALGWNVQPGMNREEDGEKKATFKEALSYRLPGFRTGKVWKMIVAALGYLFITSMCFSMEFKGADGQSIGYGLQIFQRFMVWLYHIAFVFLVCNYRGIRQKIPVVSSENRWIRIGGYIVAYMILLVIAACVCVMVEMMIP